MDKLKNFMANMGLMCETWSIVHKNFVSQGMDAKDAMAHTQAFMAVFMSNAIQNNGGKE